jgi:peptidoglycan/xylan/chitin deacetylase (PgdA/CDA1 family)
MGITKSIVYRFLPSMVGILPLQELIRLTMQKVIFPFYHLVSDEQVPHIRHLYQVRSTNEFIADLDHFLKHYKALELNDLLDSMKRGIRLNGNCFLISFDDGLREFHDVAAPILWKKGVPATCFLNSGFIDNHDLFYRYKTSLLIEWFENEASPVEKQKMENWVHSRVRDPENATHALKRIRYDDRQLLDELAQVVGYDFNWYLETQKPYLSSDQISSLVRQGFTFGAHSVDHPEYRFISEEEQIRQTKESMDAVCGRFQLDYRVFSFPFTDFNVKKSFFERLFDPASPIADVTFGGAGMKKDSVGRNIQRIPFEGTGLRAKQILGTEYLYYMMKSVMGRNTIKR